MIHDIIEMNNEKYEVLKEYKFRSELWNRLLIKKEKNDFDELIYDIRNNLILLCNEIECANIISETISSQ